MFKTRRTALTTLRPPDLAARDRILAALDRIVWDRLDVPRQLDLLRVYEVVLNRFGRPDDSTATRLIARFDPHYPSRVRELNAELCQLLVYLQAPDAAAKTVALLATPDPGRTDALRPGPAHAQVGLDARAAASVFHVDLAFWPVQGGQQPSWFHGEHQARRDRQPERCRQGRAQADPRRQARRRRLRPPRWSTGRSSRNGRSTS